MAYALGGGERAEVRIFRRSMALQPVPDGERADHLLRGAKQSRAPRNARKGNTSKDE